MTIDHLIDKLAEMKNEAAEAGDPDFGKRIVVLSDDSEGNSFGLLDEDGIEPAGYDVDAREVGLIGIDEELAQAGFTAEDVLEGAVPAVVFYPE